MNALLLVRALAKRMADLIQDDFDHLGP